MDSDLEVLGVIQQMISHPFTGGGVADPIDPRSLVAGCDIRMR